MVFLVSHVSGHRQTWCINDQTPTGRDLLEALRDREVKMSDRLYDMTCQEPIITIKCSDITKT